MNKKGHPAWNKGLPKEMQPRFGKKHLEETKIKIRNTESGKRLSDETKKKIGNSYIKTENRLRQITNLGRSRKGSLNHLWKGGISRAYKTGYYSIEYRNWRRKVFERDNFECQNCSQKRGKYITAHHIKSWAKYPKLRYNISNGVTLCEICHSRTDNYKGRANKKLQLK